MRFLKSVPLITWVIALAAVTVAFISAFGLFNNFELISYDRRMKMRPALRSSSDIVLIEIADDTLKTLGKWPLPRDFHASLVKVLKDYGASQIVFDVMFPEATAYDEVFAEEAKSAGNVYLPMVFYLEEKQKKGYLPPEAGAILSDLAPALKGAPRGESQINVFVDPDGKYRRAPLFIRYEGRNYPNLGFMSACDRLGLDAGRAEFSPGKVIIDGKLGIPVDDNAALLVNYPDRWERSFKHVSYFDILKSYSEALSGRKPHLDLGMFKGKTCFIGLTATGTADLRANPLEETYPMVGLQASIFNSVLQEKFITRAGRLANVLLALAIFAVSLLLCFKFSPLKAFLGILGFSAAYFIFAAGIFIAFGIWVDLFIPEWLMFTTYASVTFYRFFSENRRRQLLEKELDIARTIQKSFLPEEIKEFSGISISTFLEPAKFVAGDLFDILPLDEKRLGVLIGDVSGKGVPASLIMAQTLSLFRVFARQDFNCSDTLMRLNSELYGKFAGRFVTCLYMIIDTEAKRVRVASAGHGPLLVYKKKDNSIIEADIAIDVPLGIMEGVEYKDTEFGLDKADKLFVFTDGLTEARNLDSQEFGVENIKKIIGQNAGLLPQALSESLKKGVYKFSYRCPQHDDITLIVLGAT